MDNPRSCGSCSLCCKLVPVKALAKPRNQWCRHCAPGKGCAIYAERPIACKTWSCLWLTDAVPYEELNPRRSHVIFDPAIDEVRARNFETDEVKTYKVIQMWVDPAYPNARFAPAVLRAIEALAEANNAATIARIGLRNILMVPPYLSAEGVWFELDCGDVIWTEDEIWERDIGLVKQHG